MAELLAATGAVNDIDKWIDRLYDCKPLTELEVKMLCEQVINLIYTNGFML
jgi:hypothetical protein